MGKFETDFFCRIAKNTIDGGLDFTSINAQLLDLEYWQEVDEEVVIDDILKSYCYNLIDRVIYEQANNISCDREYEFEPIDTIKEILINNYGIDNFDDFIIDETDYLDMFCQFTEYLNDMKDYSYDKLLCDESEKLYDILSKDSEFIKEVEEYFE